MFLERAYALNDNTYQSFNKNSDNFQKVKYLNAQGSFYYDGINSTIDFLSLRNNLNKIFGLDENHSLELSKEYTDELGIKRYVYIHKYKDIPVDGDLALIHT